MSQGSLKLLGILGVARKKEREKRKRKKKVSESRRGT
jgi:hypothetical protein